LKPYGASKPQLLAVICVLAVVCLIACSSGIEEIDLEISSIDPDARSSSDSTITKTPRSSRTPTLTWTSFPTWTMVPTQNAMPTGNAARTPTITVMPTPVNSIPLPELKPVKAPTEYLLAIPTVQDMLHQIVLLIQLEQYRMTEWGSDDIDLLDESIQYGMTLLGIELPFYYPKGVEDHEFFWTHYQNVRNQQGGLQIYFIEQMKKSIVERINAGIIDLSEKDTIDQGSYRITVYPVELDHDPDPEFLVLLDLYDISTWLVLDKHIDGGYKPLEAQLPDSWLLIHDSSIKVLQDFTGDGLTDIVILQHYYAGGTDMYSFHIASGTPRGFMEVASIRHEVYGLERHFEKYYEIKFPPESQELEIILIKHNTHNWDCYWETFETYRWTGGKQHKTVKGLHPPVTPRCLLSQAVSVRDPVNIATSLRLLQRALPEYSKGSPESMFIHYRLAVLFAFRNHQPQARRHYQAFVDQYQESQAFREDVLMPLLQKELDGLELCELFHDDTDKIPEAWLKEVGVTAAVNAYPHSHELYPPAVCPMESILAEITGQVLQSTSQYVQNENTNHQFSRYRDLITAAYTSPSPKTVRTELLTARSALNRNQSHIWQMLTYLIGITYQREGLEREAVEAFVSILHQQPQTFWWSQALTHLQER
jgi:hypothetical protein